ncbi:hypothetical protein BC828DRAFT_398385 [Blastocladiella britannica]|nr:hypothetical protein BC828DRAFT_398385 [Blastocladiella britannica]
MCLSSIGAFQACSALDVNSCVPGFLCMPQEVNRDARWTCRPAPNPPSSPGSTTTSALASSPPTSTPNGNSDPSKNDAHTKPFQIALQFVIFASALATVYWLQKSRPVVATSTEAPPTYTAAPRSGEVVATATPIRSAGAADDIPLREIPAAASLGPIPVAPAEVTPKPPSYSR